MSARTASCVYHFTDSLHLPWIVESGELRPYINRLKGIGNIQYLWGTTNPLGDKTAQALMRQNINDNDEDYQFCSVQTIRFTLPPAGFVPWRDIKRRSPWTKQQIEELEADDRERFGEYGQAKWRCRRKALPIKSALKIEAWRGGWVPIKPTKRHLIKLPDGSLIMGINIDGFDYYSRQCQNWMEIDGHYHDFDSYGVPDRDEMHEFLEELRELAWESEFA